MQSEVTNVELCGPMSPHSSLWRRALMTTAAAVAQDNHPHYRVERDTFGDIKVPADKYWGAQTQRYFLFIFISF
jgi:fumarate hydratase class II